MPEYTLEEVCTMLDALTTRVNLIDGENLTNPLTGDVAQLQNQINSLNTDLQQVVLQFETTMNSFKAAINNAIATLNSLTGSPSNSGQLP
jgi:uncharacterized protein YlxW (UPF0749 family)